jgi:hypothetical protein
MRGIFNYRNPSKHLTMKTPMNQLIAELQKQIEVNSLVNTAIMHYGLRSALELVKRYEKMERQTIEDAYDNAKNYPSPDCDGSKYYFMTYITND